MAADEAALARFPARLSYPRSFVAKAKSAGSIPAASKKVAPPTVIPGGRLWRTIIGPGRKPVAAIVMLGALGAGWWFLWNGVRQRVLTKDEYRLSLERIEISPLPPWVQADIKRRVIDDANLDGATSALDPDLAPRLAQAFRLHPGVAKVEQVSVRYPATIVARLIYREPVMMVETIDGLVPVDKEGVVLPKDDFSPAEARTYPRMINVRDPLRSAEGARWGDVDVANAAKIAALLRPHWQKLKLDHIAAPRSASPGKDHYQLFTRGGTQIIWGSPPGSEQPGEMTAEAKLARLSAYAAEHGSLDAEGGRQSIDLSGDREQLIPRTAARPQSTDGASE
jgi:hypothetical protein